MSPVAEPSNETIMQFIFGQLPALGMHLNAGESLYALASQHQLYQHPGESVWRFLVRLEARLIQRWLLAPQVANA